MVPEMLNIQGSTKQKRFGKKAKPLETGGGKRDRTADLLHAMQALYQLSYTPEIWWRIRDSNPGHKDYDSSALTD